MAPLANPLKRKLSGRPSKNASSSPASAPGSAVTTSAGPGTPVEPEEHAVLEGDQQKAKGVETSAPADAKLDALLEQLRQAEEFNAAIRSQVEADVQEGEAVELAAAELDRRTRGGSLVSPKKSAGRPAKRSKTAKGKDVSTADQEAKMMGQELEAVDMEDLNLRRLDLSLLADGVVLKPFQRTGVIWLAALDYQGAGGILGDEMGLGKTLQTIALLAHLRAKGLRKFNLIIVPKAVLTNWESEFKKFAPSLPILLYHGDKTQRKILRETRLGLVEAEQAPLRRQQRLELKMGKTLNGTEARGLRLSPIESKIPPDEKPIIITSYEFAVRDRQFLETLRCGIIIADEGQRLKNKDSKTVKELSQYLTDTRFLLTGTPLQNNLTELWSLLSFILPSTFYNLGGFMDFFDKIDKEAGNETLRDKLHQLLQPWMLRRLKTDVELNLPPKKEYILTVPLTAAQKELYASIVSKNLRGFLLTDKTAPLPVDGPSPRKRRKSTRSFREETDDEFFANAEAATERPPMDAESVAEIGKAHQQKKKVAAINNQHLQNAVIQMRKAANHPLLFHADIDSILPADVHAELRSSGKMLLLERLLVPLLKKRHKVLIFSQFVTMLDIVHKWCDEIKGWPVCLIKGDVDLDERRQQIEAFDDPSHDSPHIFLLSTRAGGVGINLTAADTVIFFDSDWNPQQDLQALARAHRIGQTKPVVAYRMVSSNTIEEKILERAAGKRKLESLVLGHDKFAGGFADFKEIKGGSKRKGPTLAEEFAEELAQEAIQDLPTLDAGDVVFTDTQLAALLDRSDAAMKSTATIGGKSKFSAKVTVTKTFGDEDVYDELDALFDVDVRPEVIVLD